MNTGREQLMMEALAEVKRIADFFPKDRAILEVVDPVLEKLLSEPETDWHDAYLAEQQACVDALSRLTDAEDKINELNARAEDSFRLLRKVKGWHSNPDSPEYNGCDVEQCHWCDMADKIMEAQA